jgi:hypothetical protein
MGGLRGGLIIREGVSRCVTVAVCLSVEFVGVLETCPMATRRNAYACVRGVRHGVRYPSELLEELRSALTCRVCDSRRTLPSVLDPRLARVLPYTRPSGHPVSTRYRMCLARFGEASDLGCVQTHAVFTHARAHHKLNGERGVAGIDDGQGR